MGLYLKLFEVLFPVFLVIGIGYWYGKRDPKFDTKFITTLAGNIGLPCIIFYSLTTSNVDLSGLELETAGDNKRAFILNDQLMAYLNDSRAIYDYILIDCPPSLSLLTVMALVSSNSLLVPLQTEFFALEGLTQLMKTIERIKVNLNPDLVIQGILLTMYDRRNKLSSQVEEEARSYFKDKVYQTVIPRNVRLSESPWHGVPVLIYDKICPGSKSYFNFTDEFMNQEKIFESSL